jgi:PAS domain S-box-containing protein
MAGNSFNFSASPAVKLSLSIAILLLVFAFLGISIYEEIYQAVMVIKQQRDLQNKLILLTNLTTAQERLLGLLFTSLIVIIALGATMALEVFVRVKHLDALSQKMMVAIEAAGDGIGIIDSKGNLDYMNRALLDLHGLGNADKSAYIGKPWTSLYTEKGCQQIRRSVMPVLQKTGLWRGESPIVRKDGALAYAEMSLTCLGDGAIIGTARDITGQKKSEAEKEALQQQFMQMQKMETVGRLTGGIAHDFNNMLSVISGNLDIIADYVSKIPSMENHVMAAQRAVERGSELTQRLLAFSRKQVLKPVPTNINEIVPETIKLIKRALPANIEIAFISEKNLWTVEIDIGQLENALLNLCINARDAMQEHTVGCLTFKTLNVMIAQDDPQRRDYMLPGPYVLVSVTDTGEGIPPEIMDRVFEPFFTTKDPIKGSGLGLSMVYGFVKQSRGYVTIDSTVGSGTSVNLFFPRAAQKEENSHQ